MMSDPERCGICGKTEPEHEVLNHVFSTSGQLIAKAQQKPKREVVVAPDYILRALLMEKGIITGEELIGKEAEFNARFTQARRITSDRLDSASSG